MSVVDGLPFSDQKKKYIVDTLDPILEEMVSDVLTDMPDVPLDYMISWLQKRSGVASSSKVSVTERNKQLKSQLKQMTGSLEEAGTAVASGDIEEEEEEEDDDNELDEVPESFMKREGAAPAKARQSVSAEAYGQWNTKKAFTAPVHAKSDEQKERLRNTLMQSFMFNAMENNDMETILMAMKECVFSSGTQVIKEGEDGDYLFVIEKGTLECIKFEKVVKTCNAGDVFGELALLYNCPRAASVVAKDECVCWQLDRDTFNNIVKDAAVKRRNKYDAFLKSVSLISNIGDYERSQISDALKPEIFSKGDVIVKEGDPGDKFYIVEEGSLTANKGPDAKPVMHYKSGDYFGELALLKNQPRAASVVVNSDMAKVLSMSRSAFTKMLGNLQSLLAKQVANYA